MSFAVDTYIASCQARYDTSVKSIQHFLDIYTKIGQYADVMQDIDKHNDLMKVSLTQQENDLITSDRVAFYEEQQIVTLEKWYFLLVFLYRIFSVIFCVVLFASSKLSRSYKSGLFALVVAYPFYINFLVVLVITILRIVWNIIIQKNVYAHF